jgi:hypothetical protein
VKLFVNGPILSVSIAILLKKEAQDVLRWTTFFLDRWGGRDDEINLALACTRCNGRRYNFIDGIDPETQSIVRLFNPRQDDWKDHFIWSQDGQRIIALSSIGRATLMRLDMNDDRHDDGSICRARRLWIRGGWHPPSQDPQLG